MKYNELSKDDYLTRLTIFLLKNTLYSLQTLANSVPKATTNASSLVHTLAYTINISHCIDQCFTHITNCSSECFRHIRVKFNNM